MIGCSSFFLKYVFAKISHVRLQSQKFFPLLSWGFHIHITCFVALMTNKSIYTCSKQYSFVFRYRPNEIPLVRPEFVFFIIVTPGLRDIGNGHIHGLPSLWTSAAISRSLICSMRDMLSRYRFPFRPFDVPWRSNLYPSTIHMTYILSI